MESRSRDWHNIMLNNPERYIDSPPTRTTKAKSKIISVTTTRLSPASSSSSTKNWLGGFTRRAPMMLVSFSIALAILANTNTVSLAVDCFKCSSRNGSNPACEDPFHNLNTTRVNTPASPDPPPSVIYHTPCYAGKKGRDGLFPASACIKLTGTFDTTGETLVVRHCALDSGTLTQDTELARMSHCGKFQFEGDLLKGCVLACPEDACNSAPSSSRLQLALMVPILNIFMSPLIVVAGYLLKHRNTIGESLR